MTRAEMMLAQAREALAWNRARAALPEWQRAACIKMEMLFARVRMKQRAWEQSEPRWGLEL